MMELVGMHEQSLSRLERQDEVVNMNVSRSSCIEYQDEAMV